MPDYEPGLHRAARAALGRGYRQPYLMTGPTLEEPFHFQSMMARGFTRAVKDAFSNEERIELLEMLWEVAYIDG